MANTEIIDSVVDPSALKQFADLQAASDAANASMVDTLKAATALNNQLNSTSGIANFNKAQENAAAGIDKVTASTEKSRLAEIKLQQAREKAFDDYEKKLAKQASAKKAAADKDDLALQKQLASEVKIAKQRANDSRAYVELSKNLELLRGKAKDLGATFGENSQIFLDAAKEVQELDGKVKNIDKSLGQSQRNVGNYAESAFGVVRKLAYILPGIGVAGIFGLLSDGILKFYQSLTSGETVRTTLNNLERKAADIYGEQLTNVRLLTAEAQDQNTTALRREQIIEDLNKISPTYFGNLKSEADIVSKLPDDYKRYNAALLESSRSKAAAEIIGEKYKEILQLQRDIIEGQDAANPDRAGGFAALQELSVAVDALAAPGKEAQIKKLQEQINRLTKEYVSSSQKAGDINGEQAKLQERFTNEALDYNKQLLQNRIDINNDIANNDKKSYADRHSALKAVYNDTLTLQKYSETQELNDNTLALDQQKAIQDKFSFDALKAKQDFLIKSRDLDDKAAADRRAAIVAEIEAQKSQAKTTVDNPNADYQDRIEALDNYLSKSQQLLKINYDADVRNAGDNADKKKAIAQKYNRDLSDLDNEQLSGSIKINKEAQEKIKSIFQQGVKDQEALEAEAISNVKDGADKRLLEIEGNKADTLSVLADQYKQGVIGEKDFNQQKQDIEQQAQHDSLQVQVDAAKQIVDIRKGLLVFGIGSNKELQKSEDDLTKSEIALSKNSTDAQIADAQRVAEAKKQLHEKEQELAEKAFDLVQTLVDAGYQNQINGLQQQSKLLDDNAAKEKQQVENSLASSATKARQEAVIDAQTKQRQDQLAAQEAKIKTQQAKFDKAIAVARIIEETAVAVVSVLSIPIYGEVLAAVIAGIGAAELATVVAQPIPAYKDGGFTKPGLSLWGEAGTEVAREPGGKVHVSNGATISRFPVGTQIISNADLAKYARPSDLGKYTGGQQVPWGDILSELRKNKPVQGKRPVVVFKGVDPAMLKRMRR